MEKGERKIASGRFRINMASREVNSAMNEGELACSHRNCSAVRNNVFFF